MFSSFSEGARGWKEVQQPSVEVCQAVILAAKGGALRYSGGYGKLLLLLNTSILDFTFPKPMEHFQSF
jgi:hypothetical protein